tara:strand:- start:4331 stop:4480 length:150 start_codon:yes stop_codon:yes gene_type:complete
MDYETARVFAATWGLIGLVVMFVGALVYALWPRNRDKFDDAAHIPLKED